MHIGCLIMITVGLPCDTHRASCPADLHAWRGISASDLTKGVQEVEARLQSVHSAAQQQASRAEAALAQAANSSTAAAAAQASEAAALGTST